MTGREAEEGVGEGEGEEVEGGGGGAILAGTPSTASSPSD